VPSKLDLSTHKLAHSPAIVRPLISERHLLGHEWIDRDLRAIADGWFRAVTCEPTQFQFFLARMKKLMRSHFDHEATLMRSSGGMLCECHHNEHRMLIDLCDQAYASSHKNWPRTQSLLRNRFPRLIRSHIAGMDQVAVLFIDANRSARAH
jgi:hemerythrin